MHSLVRVLTKSGKYEILKIAKVNLNEKLLQELKNKHIKNYLYKLGEEQNWRKLY